jgi:hypothetical protein
MEVPEHAFLQPTCGLAILYLKGGTPVVFLLRFVGHGHDDQNMLAEKQLRPRRNKLDVCCVSLLQRM